MLLGGSRYLLPVIEAAHKLGLYVITCDYLPNNVAHKHSDEYCNISIVDKNAVLEKATELNIDGIMSFACDPGVETAAYVAEKMGLPSVGPYESVCILQNKGKFREFLKENGFNVPFAKKYTSIQLALKDINIYKWPVIVKPTDSAGSKGVTKVDVASNLSESIKHALAYSRCGEFIIEEFLEQKGQPSDADGLVVDGTIEIISYSSQYFDKEAKNPYVPSAFGWPTTISIEKQKELQNEVQRLLRLLNMETSIYNIEVRECLDDKAYIMECSPRGGGNRLSEMLRYSTGIDIIDTAIRAAVNEEVNILHEQTKTSNGYWAEIILHGRKAGKFSGVWIEPSIERYVVEKDIWIKVGAEVNEFSGANETLGTLIFRFKTEQMMREVLEAQEQYVEVVIE